MKVDLEILKKLRNETKVSVADCRRALEASGNDYKKALDWLKKNDLEKAAKKSDRQTSQGLIESYIHQNGKIGAMVEVLCETDFVARTDEFKYLAHEIAMQIAAMNPKDVRALLREEYIRDNSKTIDSLLREAIAKLGENIAVRRFHRFGIGE